MPPSPHEVRFGLEHVLYGLLLPYLLRAGLLGLIFGVLNRLVGGDVRRLCITGAPGPADGPMQVDEEAKCTSSVLLRSSWQEVRMMLGWNRGQAVAVSILRLLFWHSLQPLLLGLIE